MTDEEGQKLQQIVRRGEHESVRVRQALIIMASASGTPVTAIARLVAAHEDTVRDVTHAFNAKGLAALDPRWAGGRPRLISDDEREFIVATARTRPAKLGRPFTHWSVRKLADYLAHNRVQRVNVGRERLRQTLHEHGISFQGTHIWKESKDPPARDPGRVDEWKCVLDGSRQPQVHPPGSVFGRAATRVNCLQKRKERKFTGCC
ncbi:transposase [Streptomyces avermitilis]|uniref:helix-turn-helix domain-containing protein n=1 Tax=Streptomyces avermitilis TaxID=33903 RepID=UPI00382F4145